MKRPLFLVRNILVLSVSVIVILTISEPSRVHVSAFHWHVSPYGIKEPWNREVTESSEPEHWAADADKELN